MKPVQDYIKNISNTATYPRFRIEKPKETGQRNSLHFCFFGCSILILWNNIYYLTWINVLVWQLKLTWPDGPKHLIKKANQHHLNKKGGKKKRGKAQYNFEITAWMRQCVVYPALLRTITVAVWLLWSRMDLCLSLAVKFGCLDGIEPVVQPLYAIYLGLIKLGHKGRYCNLSMLFAHPI